MTINGSSHTFTRHAAAAAAVRGIPVEEICAVLADPDLTYPSMSSEGKNVTVMERDRVRIVVGEDGQAIVSAAWNADVVDQVTGLPLERFNA